MNNFRRVFGQSTVHLMCRCVVQTSGVREWTVFLLQHAGPASIHTWPIILQLEKRKKPWSYEYYIYRHQTKAKVYFYSGCWCMHNWNLFSQTEPVEILFFFSIFSVPVSFNFDWNSVTCNHDSFFCEFYKKIIWGFSVEANLPIDCMAVVVGYLLRFFLDRFTAGK